MKIKVDDLKKIIKEEIQLNEMSSWRQQLEQLAIGVSDAVANALLEELSDFMIENRQDKINSIVERVQRMIRQEFKSDFVPQEPVIPSRPFGEREYD